MALNRLQCIVAAPQDRKEWRKLYYQHQKSYLRRRLDAIKLLWDGLKMVDVCIHMNCNVKSLRKWVNSYLSGGFKELLTEKVSGKLGKGKLSKKQF